MAYKVEHPKVKLPPVLWEPQGNLLVLHVPEKDVTTGGLVLPDGTGDPSETGTGFVLACGPECKFFKPGDEIIFGTARAEIIRRKGHKYIVINEDRIIGGRLIDSEKTEVEDVRG